LAALPTFATEANALAADVTSKQGIASTAATTATTQAGIAETQAAIATTQAGLATTAKEQAESLVASYQGSLSSDPTLNKTGGALSAGDWYVNTSTGYIRVYNGSAWVQGLSAVAGVTSINAASGALTLKTVGNQSLLGSGNIATLEVGDTLTTTRTLSSPDYLPCDGGTYLQSSYAALFAELGLISNSFPGTKLANPTTLPTGTGRSVSFSSDASYLAVGHSTSPFITVYSRSGSTLTKLANPSTLPANNVYGVAFDASASYLAVASETSPRLSVYSRSGSTLTKLTDPPSQPGSICHGVSFSSAGDYLAVAISGSPCLQAYARSGSTFTK
jgi:hypothetical protein